MKCFEQCVGLNDTIRHLESALFFLDGITEPEEEGGDLGNLEPTISRIIRDIKLAAAGLGVADLKPFTPKASLFPDRRR